MAADQSQHDERLTWALQSLFTPEVRRIVEAFAAAGHECRVVGGAVRDVYLGRTPNDVDLVTDCPLEAITPVCQAAGMRVKPIRSQGLAQGQIINMQVFPGPTPCDVVPLKPLLCSNGDIWMQDAAHRDFTINAMSANMNGELFDYFGGIRHCDERIVQWIGCIGDSILEAPTRLSRYFRFHGEALNGFGVVNSNCGPAEHNMEVLREMAANVSKINCIAPESQRDALFRVISKCGRYAVKPELEAMARIGLLTTLLPHGVEVDLEGAHEMRLRQEHWKAIHKVAVEPLLTLAALLKWQPAALQAVAEQLVFSHESQEFCRHCCAAYAQAVCPTLQQFWCQLWAIDGFDWRRNAQGPAPQSVERGRLWLLQLLLIHDMSKDVGKVRDVPVLKLPISMQELQRFVVNCTGHGLDGKEVIEAMVDLRQRFVASMCQLDAGELLDKWYKEWYLPRCDHVTCQVQRSSSNEFPIIFNDELSFALSLYVRSRTS